MCNPDVEKEIEKLGPEVSRIYFDAKHELATCQDSRSERFAAAARVVRSFLKKFRSS
jgi:hypothetical protein